MKQELVRADRDDLAVNAVSRPGEEIWTNERASRKVVIRIDDAPAKPRDFDNAVGHFYGAFSPRYHYGDERLDAESLRETVAERLRNGDVAFNILVEERDEIKLTVVEYMPDCKWETAGVIVVDRAQADELAAAGKTLQEVVEQDVADYEAWANGLVYEAASYEGVRCGACGSWKWKSEEVFGNHYGADHAASGLYERAGIPTDHDAAAAAGWRRLRP